MKKLVFATLRLAALLLVAVWFVDRSGTARVVWNGYLIETSAAFLGFLALLVGFLFYLAFRFRHMVRHGPANLGMRKRLKNMQRGHLELTQGLVAVAGGDTAEAGRRAVQARRLLGTTVATQLLQAQAAQLAGDSKSAQEIFHSLASDPESAVLGYRGLIMEARRERNWIEMERLVEKLHRLKPETPWLNLVRFELLARRETWDDATLALDEAGSSRLLDPVRVKQHKSAILVATAQDEMRGARYDLALAAAERALKHTPGWLPAVINLARAQSLAGHKRAMLRTIEKNWKLAPHPDLAALIREAAEDPVDACKQIEKLCAGNEDLPASRLILAEAALAADIWGSARRHLTTLIGTGAVTQMVYRLMAKLERREMGDEQAAFQWMSKAVDAPSDPVWLCHSCGGIHKDWQALCRHCGSFNTLDWQSPGISRGKSSGNFLAYREQDIVGELVSPHYNVRPGQ